MNLRNPVQPNFIKILLVLVIASLSFSVQAGHHGGNKMKPAEQTLETSKKQGDVKYETSKAHKDMKQKVEDAHSELEQDQDLQEQEAAEEAQQVTEPEPEPDA